MTQSQNKNIFLNQVVHHTLIEILIKVFERFPHICCTFKVEQSWAFPLLEFSTTGRIGTLKHFYNLHINMSWPIIKDMWWIGAYSFLLEKIGFTSHLHHHPHRQQLLWAAFPNNSSVFFPNIQHSTDLCFLHLLQLPALLQYQHHLPILALNSFFLRHWDKLQ